MSGGSEERHMGAIVSHAVQIHSWSTRHRNKASQTVLSHVVQWVCHAINKSSYMCLFYSKEQGIFRPQNYLAHACRYEAGLLWDDTVCVPTQATRNTSLLHHLILTTHYHTDTMLTSSPFPWCAAYSPWCRQKFGLVKFRKYRVKIQIWGEPAIFFSWTVHNGDSLSSPTRFETVTSSY